MISRSIFGEPRIIYQRRESFVSREVGLPEKRAFDMHRAVALPQPVTLSYEIHPLATQTVRFTEYGKFRAMKRFKVDRWKGNM